MKRVAIIGQDIHPDGKEAALSIARSLGPYAASRRIQCEPLYFRDLILDISTNNVRVIHALTGEALDRYDCALLTNWFSSTWTFREVAFSLALFFSAKDIPCLNTESLFNRSASKLSQMVLAATHGVLIPRTIFCLSLDHLETYLRSEHFQAPFIFKDATASRGSKNYLLNSIDEMGTHAAQGSDPNPFLVQQFVPNRGIDYRFFVAGGQTRLVIQRTGTGVNHLNNTSQGATTKIFEPNDFSPKVTAAVRRMSQILHREVTGIDILLDEATDEPYFLEANPIPQIATGSNVELKLSALADALQELTDASERTLTPKPFSPLLPQ